MHFTNYEKGKHIVTENNGLMSTYVNKDT